jgi:hypothetical protein
MRRIQEELWMASRMRADMGMVGFLFPVSCFRFPVFGFLFSVSCFRFPVFGFLTRQAKLQLTCHISHVGRALPAVSQNMGGGAHPTRSTENRL